MRSAPIWLAALLAATFTVVGCACTAPPPAAPQQETGAAQQAIVERAANALVRMRQNPQFSGMEPYLERARAVLIFPRLVKASLIFGGQGGSGVLSVRGSDGSWSDPAFYSLGAPSVGLQIGYEQSTVVLFILEEGALQDILYREVVIGRNASAAIGDIQSSGGEVLSKPIYQAVEAGGAFAGWSLDGYVIRARNKHNFAYYGPGGTPRAILIDRSVHRAEAEVLRRVLAPQAERPASS